MAGGVNIELGVAVLEKIAAKLDALDARMDTLNQCISVTSDSLMLVARQVAALDAYIRGSGKSLQAQPPSPSVRGVVVAVDPWSRP